jgi:hypothetical protein
MSIRTRFTEEEWQELEEGVMGAGMFVSVSEPDFTHTSDEIQAFASYLAGQRQSTKSDLVRELASAPVNALAFNAPGWRIEVAALKALRAAAATLDAKAPREVDAYRDLVLGAADLVAQNRGGVRPRETEAIGKIREALGVGEER